MKDKIVEKELSYKLGGIFFKIQNNIGRFCRERQYADALEEELKKEKVNFQREEAIKIAGRKSNFADFIVEGRIVVDLKAKPFLEKEDFRQMKRYLEISEKELGLIVNFRDKYLKPRRVLNGKNFVDSDNFVVSDRKAFSLLELLIYMALLAIVMVVIVGIFLSVNSGRGQNEAQAEVNSNLRFAVDKIESDLRAATSVTTPASAGASSSTLVVNASGTVTYCVVSSTLRRQTGGGACTSSSDAITASTVLVATSTFTRLENTNTVLNKTIVSIQVDLAMSYNVTGPERQYTEEKITTVALRN